MSLENIMILITLTGFIPFIVGFIDLLISARLTGNEEKKAKKIGWALFIIGSLMMISTPITAAIVHFTTDSTAQNRTIQHGEIP